MTIFRKIQRNYTQLFLFFVLIFLSVLLCVDKRYSVSILYGLELWIFSVLPALFPYFFIVNVLSSLKITTKLAKILSPITKKLFNVSGAVGYAYMLSILSGYPVGAKIVSDLRLNNAINNEDAARGSALCSTSSPTFLIATVGGITFNSLSFGLALFLCHIISSLFVGVIFSFYKREKAPSENVLLSPNKSDNLFQESVYSAIISILTVGGIIALFYLFIDVLLNLKLLSPLTSILSLIIGNAELSKGFTVGLIECTRGIKIIAGQGANFLSLPLTAFLCGFGGISIIAQSLVHLKKAKIKTAPFIFAKILGAVINLILGFIISFIFL